MRFRIRTVLIVVTAWATLLGAWRLSPAVAAFLLLMAPLILVVAFPLPKGRVKQTLLFVTSGFTAYLASAGPAVALVAMIFAYGPQPAWVEAGIVHGYWPLASLVNCRHHTIADAVNGYVDEWADLGVTARHWFVDANGPYETQRPYTCRLRLVEEADDSPDSGT